jgi:hemolysin activation/secretion protein
MPQLMLPFKLKSSLLLLARVLLMSVSAASVAQVAVPVPPPANQPDAARAAQDAERILQQEQQRQKQERERQLQQRPTSGIDPKSLSGPGSKLPDLGAQCRDIKVFVINGAAHLPESERQKITAKYIGKCLGVVEIERLLSEITLWYVARGFITTRVYLPSQDLTAGQLELLVLEGVVEKISLKDGKGGQQHAISRKHVFPGLEARVLNLRDIEQGLDQINKLASNDAKMDIVPGSKAGASEVVVSNQPKKRFKVNASFDNQGSESTGKRQAGLGVTVDGLFGWNDFFSFTHRQAQPGDRARRFSSSDSLSYWLPYGYYTFSLNASHSRYASAIVTPIGREFGISGESDHAAIKLDKVLYRNQKSRFTLAGTLGTKDSKNYLAGELLSVSSRKLTVLDIDSNLTLGLAGGVLGLDLGYARGLSQFGALRDAANLPDEVARAQFGKIKYGASFSLPLKVASKEGAFSSQLSGQRAQDTLYGSEQILIGGIYSVRGFVDTSFSGDHGFIWRNDLSLRLPLNVWGQATVVKPYLALDHGRVSQKSGGSAASLTGAALGVSIQSGVATWEIFSAKPLRVPAGARREAASTYFRLAIAI